VLGNVRASGDTDRRELREALEAVALSLRHPDLGAGPLGKIRDASQMVEVTMRDEDPGTRRAESRKLQAEVGCIPSGVDHRALAGAALTADDVAIRLERTERISVDRERHRGRV
jgi:hypothetical protein